MPHGTPCGNPLKSYVGVHVETHVRSRTGHHVGIQAACHTGHHTGTHVKII